MKLLLQLLVGWKIEESTAFIHTPLVQGKEIPTAHRKSIATVTPIDSRRFATDSEDDAMDSQDNKEDDTTEPSPAFEMDNATVRIDDGGSDMTDRFKYKVHALMGDYDPTDGVVDNENQDGNIMRALMTFPMQQTFDVVGKISADDTGKEYAETVKRIVFETTGDENIECDVIPRGKKFTKVRCKAMVESTTMINAIYDELGEMESTVMKF